MQVKHMHMEEWLKEQITNCEEQRRELLSDGRKDEANFSKISENIYDIFLTVLSVAAQTSKGDEVAEGQFFERRLQQIPANWNDALTQAKEHGDIDKVYIETLKLEAVQRIKNQYQSIWEENA